MFCYSIALEPRTTLVCAFIAGVYSGWLIDGHNLCIIICGQRNYPLPDLNRTIYTLTVSRFGLTLFITTVDRLSVNLMFVIVGLRSGGSYCSRLMPMVVAQTTAYARAE